MRLFNCAFTILLLPVAVQACVPQSALSDAISPNIKAGPNHYSDEKPDSTFYGTGMSGRMSEASVLRFQGEQDTADGNYDLAAKKLAKAIELDPGDPSGHLLYARALNKKIKSGQGVTLELVEKALCEWKLLWHHDADYYEQLEAHLEARKLSKLEKVLTKQQRARSGEQQVAASKNSTQ